MNVLVPKYQANEIAKNADFDYGNDREYANLCTLLEELFARAANDTVIGGLNCQQRSSPSMNVDLTIGLGYCKNTGKIAHTGSLFGPIAIVDGGAQDRIDTLEVRLLETDYDQQQRAFKDPVTGNISYQDVYTKTRFEIEAQVIQGTEGAGVAPNRTVGWIKIAEIAADAGETTSILNADIENCTGGYDTEATTNWTAETAVTFRLGHVEDFKTKFRAKHKENGDHENDVIKDQHIDFGLGANQVSAIDIPINDAGGRITATETENAIQELAGGGRTVETIKQNQDDIDAIEADLYSKHEANGDHKDDVIDSQHLVAGSIDPEHLASNSVITAKILALNVTAAKLAAEAVETAKIKNLNVTAAKLATDAVETAKIKNGNVTLAKMAANSVDSNQYVDSSIDRVHLAADIIDGSKVANDVINSEHYVAGSIDNEHLASNSVNNAKIANNSINVGKLLKTCAYNNEADINGEWIVPAGLHTIIVNVGIAVSLQVWTGSTWAPGQTPWWGGTVYSKGGDNVRLYQSGGSYSIYYLTWT